MTKKYWVYWLISLALFIICTIINGTVFRIPSIIKIELAPDAQTLQNYIARLSPDMMANYHLLKMNTIVDYGYLLSYSLLTLFSFKILFAVLQLRLPWWIYPLSFITGCLDSIENAY